MMSKDQNTPTNTHPSKEPILCNCDGFWHIEVDGNGIYINAQEAIDAQVAQAVNKARIEELEATVINPIAGKSWLDVRPDVELQRVHQRLRVLKLNELETPNQVEEIE